MKKNRPSWDELFMMNAILMSKRSSCLRLNVGCVLVRDKRVISSSYNGFLCGAKHISKVDKYDHERNTCHAEQNSIADAAKRGVSVNNSAVYITHYPCIDCTKILIQSGIKNIYYLEDYKNSKYVKELCEELNIPIIKMKIKSLNFGEMINIKKLNI